MLKIYIICRFLPSAGLLNRRILSSMVLICESCKIILRNFVWSSSTFLFSAAFLWFNDIERYSFFARLLRSFSSLNMSSAPKKFSSWYTFDSTDVACISIFSHNFETDEFCSEIFLSSFLSPCGDLLFRFWKAKNIFVLITYAVVFSLKTSQC